MRAAIACRIEACANPAKARAMCKFHWQRWRNGVPLDAPRGWRPPGRRYGRVPKPAEDKVLERFGEPGLCWEWTGGRTPDGYGLVMDRTSDRRTRLYVHRVAYVVAKGAIPEGLEIDHLCRNRACFNPDHLEAVTHAENLRRAVR